MKSFIYKDDGVIITAVSDGIKHDFSIFYVKENVERGWSCWNMDSMVNTWNNWVNKRQKAVDNPTWWM